ncbi:phage tail protein [Pseudomonas sp. NPDC096950]|uniref:phage tail protein n=1 Tax=Pseudomonas sp. NPDC096950 TaxID=3364485 RepID=UPI00383B7CB5
MIDANSQFFAILTNVGIAKQANADALGAPWRITEMGVGDANGTDPIPNAAQTSLINEWRRRPLNQLKVDPANAAVIIAEQVIPADEGGKWIREIGLYDSDGDLVAVANCAPSFKPILSQGSGRTQIVRMNLIVSSTGSITLKIDPAVVLATREYVDQKIVDELNKQDFKHSVVVATTGPIVLSGPQVIDGVDVSAGSRVLVKNQAQPKTNGIYVVANGAWPRSLDADTSIEVTPGLFVHVEKGTANHDSVWQLVTDAPITLGTTDLQFEMIAGHPGIAPGTFRSVSVDEFGRVIAGTNPTSLAGYGIASATQPEAEAGADNAKPVTSLGVKQAVAAQVKPATTSLAGLIQLATASQMAAGLSDSLVPTVAAIMSIFAKRSFGKNDYIRIPDVPGGLIINFGTAAVNASGDINVNYPLGYSALEIITIALSGQNTDAAYLSTGTVLGGFTMPFYKSTTGVKSSGGFNAQWISLGR